jgi:hypothetical protein
MSKILLIFSFFIYINVHAQCDSSNTFNSVKLVSENFEEVDLSLCYEDSCDFLIVKQYYKSKSSLVGSKLIKNAAEGNYLLQGKRLILFTTEKSKFQLDLVKSDRFFNVVQKGDIIVYSYYVSPRKKLKFILLGNVDFIDIVRDDEVLTFDVPYTKAVELYQMTYQYFKLRGWK